MRVENERPAKAIRRRLAQRAFLMISIGLFAHSMTAGASVNAVILRGESLTQGAIAESVPLPSGEWLELRAMLLAGQATPYADSDLLVLDLATGTLGVAESSFGAMPMVSIDGGADTELGELLSVPGWVIALESSSSGPPTEASDIHSADQFFAAGPFGDGGRYRKGLVSVPEPSLFVLLGPSIFFLSWLSNRRNGRSLAGGG